MTVDAPTGRGATIVFTGGAEWGGSALAAALAPRLRARGRRVELLEAGVLDADGDVGPDVLGHVARVLTRNGVFVLASAREWSRGRCDVRLGEPRGASMESYVEDVIARLDGLGIL